MIVFQRGQRGGFEGESLIGTRELREISRLVGKDPLASFGWGRHGRRLEGLRELFEAIGGHTESESRVWERR